jgi:uncharacterized OB-fold protein
MPAEVLLPEGRGTLLHTLCQSCMSHFFLAVMLAPDCGFQLNES